MTADVSDAAPIGGYIFPLLPAQSWRDPVVLPAVCAGLDSSYETRRVTLAVLQASRYVDSAQGADLDAIGALVDLPRVTVGGVPEGDEPYRLRLRQTASLPVEALGRAELETALGALTGQPVVVRQGQRPARLDIVFFGVPPQGAAIVDIIAGLRAAGVDVSVAIQTSSQVSGRVGTFRLGTTPLGGAASYIVLRRGILLSSGGSATRVGTFRLGTQRLGAGSAVSWS